MEVTLGQIFEVNREENPTTGYTYFHEELSNGLKLIKSEYVKDESAVKRHLYGSPGYHIWKLKATKFGKQTLRLYYGQEWNQDTWEIKTITIYVK
jgi:inhibitor of cysteine peptidase